MGLLPTSFVHEEPQVSRHSLSLALQRFHTPTDPDRGQHAAGDRPNDQFRAETEVLLCESHEPAPLHPLAETQCAANGRTDEEMGGHGWAVFRLIYHDHEDRTHDRADVYRYQGDMKGDHQELGYEVASFENGDTGD